MSDLTSADQTFPFDSPTQPSDSDRDARLATDDEPADSEYLHRPESDPPAAHTPPVIPGPGIPEAVVWTIGMLVVHLIGMIITTAIVVMNHLSTLPAPPTNPAQLLRIIRTVLQEPSSALILITGEMAFFVVVAVAAAALRLGRNSSRRLGLTRIPTAHLVLIVTVTIPLSLMCGAFHHATTEVWNATLGDLPIFERFQGMDVNDTLKPLGETAPLWLLIAVVALAPAIGEEVIFRGVIGRGLIARHGVLAGVVMTSLMFAAVHIHPAHVIALLPLAFFIHLVYLATRSFWAPVLLHLLNNGLAAVLLKFGGKLEGSGLDEEAGMPLPIVALSATIVIMAAVALWKSRVEYRRKDDGTVWDPGYNTIELPPSGVVSEPIHRERPSTLIGMSVVSATLYTAIFVASLAMALTQAT